MTAFADAKQSAPVAPTAAAASTKKSVKTAEELYLEGNACLEADDLGCAAVALAAINPVSPYAKLLRAQLAAAANDFETPLRLLLPLQAETGLLPQAYASLHATLAQAYEAQGNTLRALEHWVACELFLSGNERVDVHQAKLWALVSGQPREVLVEMRGESANPVVQGWIDLALAATYGESRARYVEQWRAAYPDHPASEALLARIVQTRPAGGSPDEPVFRGKIALLLPLASDVFAEAAQAVQAGFMAAQVADHAKPEVAIYATGTGEDVTVIYQRAVAEGAQFIVGPLTRDEVMALAAAPMTVPTLALNVPEGEFERQNNLMFFYGLSVEGEARQVATLAREQGMQTALVIVADAPLTRRMAKAFEETWRKLDGQIVGQLMVPDNDRLSEFKAITAAYSADMIFLAMDAADARRVRPYLDPAIPTYGTSRLFDGNPWDPALTAVHFVDMPWMVLPDLPEFSRYPRFRSVELQRLYALGLDAYRLIPRLLGPPEIGRELLKGASGRIRMDLNGVLNRELPRAQFGHERLIVEERP
ncbi:MAG: penicillin-binding protein activator [Methylophilaceae bacterium]|nr:penicillin-binding protein activator [Methylophilaceae bacterium]